MYTCPPPLQTSCLTCLCHPAAGLCPEPNNSVLWTQTVQATYYQVQQLLPSFGLGASGNCPSRPPVS